MVKLGSQIFGIIWLGLIWWFVVGFHFYIRIVIDIHQIHLGKIMIWLKKIKAYRVSTQIVQGWVMSHEKSSFSDFPS